ncbi:hypothetical protein GCM10009677_37830 [Sphaerisporangium rubeum]
MVSEMSGGASAAAGAWVAGRAATRASASAETSVVKRDLIPVLWGGEGGDAWRRPGWGRLRRDRDIRGPVHRPGLGVAGREQEGAVDDGPVT